MMGDLTPRAQQALALSKRVAIELGADAVGTEHLLIGIIQARSRCCGKRIT
jgi:hypothetical protein